MCERAVKTQRIFYETVDIHDDLSYNLIELNCIKLNRFWEIMLCLRR